MGPEGALRVEILFPEGRQVHQHRTSHLLDALLQQKGQGYCLVLGEGADGTFNPWGEPWQRLDTVVARWLIPVARLVSGSPVASAGELPPWREVNPATREGGLMLSPGRNTSVAPVSRTWQAELPALERVFDDPATSSVATPPVATAFRRENVGRGMGRGGSAEILRLTFSPGSPGSWTLTTSRKPGRLELSVPLRHAIQWPGLEVFAPLWPLAEVLVFDDK
jgi:hypothetical protein